MKNQTLGKKAGITKSTAQYMMINYNKILLNTKACATELH